MSDSERPEKVAFRQLEQLVRHAGEELASFRRRALQAEARVKSLEAASEGKPVTPEQAARLRKENAELRAKLDAAHTRTRQMLERVRFLRQQHDGAPTT